VHDCDRAGQAVPAPESGEQIVDPLSVKRRLTCILAADAVGYSQQMGQDEEGTIRVLSAHRAVIDGIIIFHGGRIVSTAGDSVLAEFSSVVEAVRCAVEIQEALKTRNDALPDKSRMQFRVGVNLGDVVVKNDDLLGDGVNVAARLETLAEPGGICISSSVYDQITGKLDLGFQDIGEQALKNISRPIRVYRVSGAAVPQRSTPPAPPPGRKSKFLPWGIGAAAVVAIAAIGAWQTGWLHFGATGRGGPTSAATSGAPPTTTVPATSSAAGGAPAPQADADTQRLRADAEALKKQAEAELARARSDAEAVRATRTRADAEASASRLRAQAEADAAKIRSSAEAVAARARSDADAATRDAEARAVKAATTPRGADSKVGDASLAAAAPSAAADKAARAPASTAAYGAGYDGTWSVTVFCAPAEGASAYKLELVAQVKDNFLRGEQGATGKPGWLRLQGAIQPDGSATLDAQGLTGDPKYNLKSVAQGVPYAYHVAAHFDSDRGTGRRVELRACDLHFAKR
jgi:class 3 adenylate cyclase